MIDVNNCVFSGNLGSDAKLNEEGTRLFVNLAVHHMVDGEQRTTWVPCVMFGKRAAKLAPLMSVGRFVVVQTHFETHMTASGPSSVFVIDQVTLGPLKQTNKEKDNN